MAEIAPFRGLHFNTDKIKDLGDVITPPYDVIPKEEVSGYLNRSPYNFAHVILPQGDDDDYTRSAGLLSKWRELQILREDTSPAYYLYEQEFEIGGQKHHRRTLMCAVKLREFDDGVIRPHENTHNKYKKDRLRLLEKTECNLSHIFAMVKDPKGELAKIYEQFVFEPPLLEGSTDDGIRHAVWRMLPDKADGIRAYFAEQPIYIVDGHHRYGSALQYAKQKGVLGKDDPASYTLFAISSVPDPALRVFPTHRVAGKLPGDDLREDALAEDFHLKKINEGELEKFVTTEQSAPAFALYFGGQLFLCTPKDWQGNGKWHASLSQIAVTWSDEKVLGERCGIPADERSKYLSYVKDWRAAWEGRQDARAVIFHSPPHISHIMDVADANQFMPQKSTYFYPKLAAGLVFRALK